MSEVEIKIEICREEAVIPFYAREGDAGMDICSAAEVLLHPNETAVIPTGLKLAIPEGYEIQVRPRSGISLNTPLRISNSPGTIDSGYRDELAIIMTNTSIITNSPKTMDASQTSGTDSEVIYSIKSKGNLNGCYKINKGDRIAQIVLQKLPKMKITLVESVGEIGSNRGGGFGSTGVI